MQSLVNTLLGIEIAAVVFSYGNHCDLDALKGQFHKHTGMQTKQDPEKRWSHFSFTHFSTRTAVFMAEEGLRSLSVLPT